MMTTAWPDAGAPNSCFIIVKSRQTVLTETYSSYSFHIRCFSDITCENTPPVSSNAVFNGRISPNDDDTMNGLTNGEIKSMEVSLKQDLEKSRIQEIEESIVDASLQENSAPRNGWLINFSLYAMCIVASYLRET